MKKAVLPLIVLTSLLASCGQQSTFAPNTRDNSLTQEEKVAAAVKLQRLSQEDLQEIYNKALKQENPDEFVINELKKYKEGITAQEFGPLNAAETQVCSTSAWKCTQTLIIASGSETVAYNNFSDGQYDGRQDAFRHSYWNAVMTAEIDETWATQFANAHEQGEPYTISTAMDYHNNQVGRNIGRGYRVGQRSYIEAAIRTAVLTGRTMRVCSNSLKPTSSSPNC